MPSTFEAVHGGSYVFSIIDTVKRIGEKSGHLLDTNPTDSVPCFVIDLSEVLLEMEVVHRRISSPFAFHGTQCGAQLEVSKSEMERVEDCNSLS